MANSKNTTKKSTTSQKASSTKTTKKNVKKVEEIKETPKKVEEVKTEPKKEVKVKTSNESNFIKENLLTVVISAACLLLIVNIVLIVMGHKVELKDGKEVVATIGEEKYTADELFDTLKEKYGSEILISKIDSYIASKELNKEDLNKVKNEAKEYIDNIKSQYESAGYEWDQVLKNYGYKDEQALIDEYAEGLKTEKVVLKSVKNDITEEEVKDYYDKNIYGTYTAKHILIKPVTNAEMSDEEKSAAEEEAKAKAEEVIERYKNGEDWASLVSEYSEDEGSKENEGLIENFTKGDMADEFFNAVVALNDNEYTTEPVKSEYGYHVILRISSTEKPALKDKKEEILDALVEEKLNNDANLYDNTLIKVRKKYKFTIKDTVIKNKYEQSLSSKNK